jgi:hypothetical protein
LSGRATAEDGQAKLPDITDEIMPLVRAELARTTQRLAF